MMNMAFRKKLKLLPYKLTQRCGAAVHVRSVHRSDFNRCDTAVESTSGVHCTDFGNDSDHDLPVTDEATLHELQGKACTRMGQAKE